MPSKFSGSTLWTWRRHAAPFSASAMPRHQAAAGTGRRHLIQRHAETRRVLGDLQSRGALPRHHAGIVIGLDQGGAALGAELGGDGFAVVRAPVIGHDLRAIGAGALDLGPGRVGRHHDQGGNAEQLRRRRHALGMIAGGKRHHAFGALGVRNHQYAVARRRGI